MKKPNLFKIFVAVFALFCAPVLFSSCSEDTDTPEPTAEFSYEADGMEVTFTNSSTNALSYSWDFGDGGSSTEENPVYTYSEAGTYTVVLTATGDGGSDEESQSITIEEESKVTIDGDFSDWDEISGSVTLDSDSEIDQLQEMKVYADETYLYIYLKLTTANSDDVLDIMLDSDNDSSTGYLSGMWSNSGLDYLIEGTVFADKDAPMYQFTGTDGAEDWSWEEAVSTGSGLFSAADAVTSGDYTEFEFGLIKEMIPSISSEAVGIGLNLMNSSWTTVGALPTSSVGYTLAFYNFEDETLTVDQVSE